MEIEIVRKALKLFPYKLEFLVLSKLNESRMGCFIISHLGSTLTVVVRASFISDTLCFFLYLIYESRGGHNPFLSGMLYGIRQMSWCFLSLLFPIFSSLQMIPQTNGDFSAPVPTLIESDACYFEFIHIAQYDDSSSGQFSLHKAKTPVLKSSSEMRAKVTNSFRIVPAFFLSS